MNPMEIEAIQMTHESFPTVAATPPMENSTSGGTPLATQKAPVQSIPRSSPAPLGTGTATASVAPVLMGRSYRRCRSRTIHRTGSLPPRLGLPAAHQQSSETPAQFFGD